MEAHMKFIAIGELMLRLSPPNYEKIVTTHNFIVNYGGAVLTLSIVPFVLSATSLSAFPASRSAFAFADIFLQFSLPMTDNLTFL
jgi:hypothetical protein